MHAHRLHRVLARYRARFMAAFPALTAQDVSMILSGPSDTLLDRLQARYGITRAQAKTAWNDFVLDHVDGGSHNGGPAIRPLGTNSHSCIPTPCRPRHYLH